MACPAALFHLQGMLAIDYAALQTLLLSSLQSVLRDQAELRDSQGAFQLAVMGRLERLSLAAQQVGAAGGGLSVLLRGSGSGGSGGNAARFASLEQLLASDSDEEMATSEGSGGQEEEEGQGQEDEGELRGLSEVQAAQWLMDRLSEQAGSRGIYTVSFLAMLHSSCN